MQNGIHFISGQPRSGSTLLAAILRQNPRFHAAMMSPVGGMYMALEGAMSRRNEAAVFIEEAQRRDVLKGLFTNYYHMIQKDKLVFDTNRVWCAKLPALTQLFPKARIVCCVRDLPWIMDSIERLVRKNAFELSGMFGYDPGSTVYTRINRLATGEGMVRHAFDALKEGFFGEQASRLILVEYEALARTPKSSTRFSMSLLSTTISRMSNTRLTILTSRSAPGGYTPSAARSNGSSGKACCPRNSSNASQMTCSGGGPT